MNILIGGGSGLIGGVLVKALLERGHAVKVLTRNAGRYTGPSGATAVTWDGKSAQGWEEAAMWAEAIVNLAGENIGAKRWTAERKEQILASRVNSGRAIVEAVRAGAQPKVVVQASAIGYYGTSFSENFYERSKAGKDFLAKICQEWENSTREVEESGVRRVIVRTGIVLDAKEGALARMTLPFKLFAGGQIGSGRQWLSWIHMDDEVNAICYLIENSQAKGVYNLTAPQPVTNAVFGRALGKVLSRPYWLPVPTLALKVMLGEMSVMVLAGQRVLPERLIAAGFRFKYGEIAEALADTLGKKEI